MDYVALFYCLSSLKSPNSYVEYFMKNERFIVGDVKVAVNHYLGYYQDRGSFPDFPSACATLGIDVSGFSLDNIGSYYGSVDNATSILWEKFTREISTIELKSLESQLITETDEVKKKKILEDYTRKIVSSSSTVADLLIKDIDIPMYSSPNLTDPEGLVFPVENMVQHFGTLSYGHSLTILAPPGSFKTTMALNMVFLNSVVRDKRCAYIYLEDMADQYQKKLFSRFTLAYCGQGKVHKDELIRGTDDPTQKLAIETGLALYKDLRKGAVFYVNMAGFSKEPLYFIQQFAKFVNDFNIDYVVVDHVQKFSSFLPPHSQKYEYLNQMVSNLSSCALGQFNNRPFSVIFLSQMTKETIKKGNKLQGRFELSDSAEIAAIERDSVCMVSLWADDALKVAGEVKYQILKSRNSMTVTDPIKTRVEPGYCFFGDVTGLNDVYSPTALHDNFSSTDFAQELL